jgi:hypothetical protein
MKKDILSRREFLKLSGATVLSILLSELKLKPSQAASVHMQGRVLATNLNVRDSPSFSGKKLTSVKRDSILDLAERIQGGQEGDYNRIPRQVCWAKSQSRMQNRPTVSIEARHQARVCTMPQPIGSRLWWQTSAMAACGTRLMMLP